MVYGTDSQGDYVTGLDYKPEKYLHSSTQCRCDYSNHRNDLSLYEFKNAYSNYVAEYCNLFTVIDTQTVYCKSENGYEWTEERVYYLPL